MCKQFEYDLDHMRIGKPIERSHSVGVVPPSLPTPRKTKVRYAMLAAVPAAVVAGALLKGNRRAAKPPDRQAEPGAQEAPDRSKA